MAARYALLLDPDKCVGCEACSVECARGNALNSGEFRSRIHRKETGTYPKVSLEFVKRACMHCATAPCTKVCPVGATYVQTGGVVVIDKEKCLGCGLCLQACPFGARRLTTGANGKKIADKCDLCYVRVRSGKGPLCAEKCPARAITFGDRDALLAKVNGTPVYGRSELGGLGVLIILRKELSRYDLPRLS